MYKSFGETRCVCIIKRTTMYKPSTSNYIAAICITLPKTVSFISPGLQLNEKSTSPLNYRQNHGNIDATTSAGYNRLISASFCQRMLFAPGGAAVGMVYCQPAPYAREELGKISFFPATSQPDFVPDFTLVSNFTGKVSLLVLAILALPRSSPAADTSVAIFALSPPSSRFTRGESVCENCEDNFT